tara:strand:- start:55 stop:999 length:945 start_codon:yes stop_codon:yes gene_type:complete
MFGNQWHKKEKPLQTMIGLFGGATSLVNTGPSGPNMVASGGSKYTYGVTTIHKFTSPGSFIIDSGSGDVEYIVVAGGGGSAQQGGGGGAGGLLTGTTPLSGPQTIPITVGSGGEGSPSASSRNEPGTNGGTSQFGPTIQATGGGGGGARWGAGQSGGSGGGANGNATAENPAHTFGEGTPGQGYDGAGGSDGPHESSGGGGGAGAAGSGLTSNVGGAGGVGVQAPETFRDPTNPFGTPGPSGAFWLAGGGAGSVSTNPGGTGGEGGAGGGGDAAVDGTGTSGNAGTTNTGGGAGGSAYQAAGLDGGPGIVLVAY